MPIYSVRFEHDHGYSYADIEADTAQAALEKAKIMTRDDYTFCEHYEVDDTEIFNIFVESDDGLENVLEWRNPESLSGLERKLLEALDLMVSQYEQVCKDNNVMGFPAAVSLARATIAEARGQ